MNTISTSSGCESGECNHFPGEVGNADWRSHVQHENVTAVTEHRALEDERYSLGNSHEIACNLRVSDSDRSTAAIWRAKVGTTLPEEPSTLPKRTAVNFVPECCRAIDWM